MRLSDIAFNILTWSLFIGLTVALWTGIIILVKFALIYGKAGC